MKKLALCIGINDYPGTSNDLSGCVNDANDWTVALEKHGFDCKKLLNFEATRSAVISSIKDMLNQTVKGDSIIIQNSTHGTQVPDANNDEPDGMDEAICIISDNKQKLDVILDDEFWAMFKFKKPGVTLVMFADSCHSGSVARAFAPPHLGKKKFLPFDLLHFMHHNGGIFYGLREPKPMDDEKSPWPVLQFGGCCDNEYSYDAVFRGRPNGAFSRAAIDTLNKLPKGSTYTMWYNEIKRLLPSNDYPQSPTMIGSYKNAPILS